MKRVWIKAEKIGPVRSAGLDPPQVKLDLSDDQHVVGVEHHSRMGGGDRKTDDHYFTVWIVQEAPTP